jgi:hypothetical protein
MEDIEEIEDTNQLSTLEFFSEMGPRPFKDYERSISTWKTDRIPFQGNLLIRINDDSDGNQQYAGKVYRVIRYEFNGGKTIFSTEKEYEVTK